MYFKSFASTFVPDCQFIIKWWFVFDIVCCMAGHPIVLQEPQIWFPMRSFESALFYDMNLLRSYLTTACKITDAPVAQSSAEQNSSG